MSHCVFHARRQRWCNRFFYGGHSLISNEFADQAMTQTHTTPQITSIPTGVMEEYERRLAEIERRLAEMIRPDGDDVISWKAACPIFKQTLDLEFALNSLRLFVQFDGRAPVGKRVMFYFVGRNFGFGQIEPWLIQATTDPVTSFLIWALDQMGLKARVAFAAHVTKDGCMSGEIWIETYLTP